MYHNTLNPLGLFSHKTDLRNTCVPATSRGSLLQLIDWVKTWMMLNATAPVEEAQYRIGVVPDALVAQQLKQALPELCVVTGDEAPGQRKRILNQCSRPNGACVVISRREAQVWLRQHPENALLMWVWGAGLQRLLNDTRLAVLLQQPAHCATVRESKVYRFPRVVYWGSSIPKAVMETLGTGQHRIMWVMHGLRQREQTSVLTEAAALFPGKRASLTLLQHCIGLNDLINASIFLTNPKARVLCCDATSLSALFFPRHDMEGNTLHYHLVLESRYTLTGTLNQDITNAHTWDSIRHYVHGWRDLRG